MVQLKGNVTFAQNLLAHFTLALAVHKVESKLSLKAWR